MFQVVITTLKKEASRKLLLVLGRPGGFLHSLRNYSCAAHKFPLETRLLQTACLLLHALSGSWLLGFDGLSAATQCSALSGNHRVTLMRYFFIPLLVPPSGGIGISLVFCCSIPPLLSGGKYDLDRELSLSSCNIMQYKEECNNAPPSLLFILYSQLHLDSC
jgi:hypothetical protein